MRDLDAKGVIRGDFILTCGDTVANVDLLPVLKKHRFVTVASHYSCLAMIFFTH